MISISWFSSTPTLSFTNPLRSTLSTSSIFLKLYCSSIPLTQPPTPSQPYSINALDPLSSRTHSSWPKTLLLPTLRCFLHQNFVKGRSKPSSPSRLLGKEDLLRMPSPPTTLVTLVRFEDPEVFQFPPNNTGPSTLTPGSRGVSSHSGISSEPFIIGIAQSFSQVIERGITSHSGPPSGPFILGIAQSHNAFASNNAGPSTSTSGTRGTASHSGPSSGALILGSAQSSGQRVNAGDKTGSRPGENANGPISPPAKKQKLKTEHGESYTMVEIHLYPTVHVMDTRYLPGIIPHPVLDFTEIVYKVLRGGMVRD